MRGHADCKRTPRAVVPHPRRALARPAAALALLLAAAPAIAAPEQRPRVATQLPLGAPPVTPADPALAALGESLFFSPLLSRDGSVSCASCHSPSAGLSGTAPRAIGVGGVLSARRAPPIFGLGSAKALMWDGRAHSLKAQLSLPLEGPEMAIGWRQTMRWLRADGEIRERFRAARLAPARPAVVTALVAYVGSLTAGGSRFDRYYYGKDESALTPQEVRGWRLFSREARCASCHLVGSDSAAFTDGGFHSIGIAYGKAGYADIGRAGVTSKAADTGLFKTPSLRDVGLRPRLMHDGSMASLRQVVDYYNRGGNPGAPNIDPRVQPLYLGAQEIDDLLAFLASLASEPSSALPPRGVAQR